MINFVFQQICGYKICRIRTYGLGAMNFRSLSIFLKNNYGIYTLLTGVSPEFRRSWRRNGPDVNEWPNGGEDELERCRGEIVLVLRRGGEAAGVAKTGKSRRAIPLEIERYKDGFSGRGMRASRRSSGFLL